MEWAPGPCLGRQVAELRNEHPSGWLVSALELSVPLSLSSQDSRGILGERAEEKGFVF